jgi:hypothetical protein
MCPGSKGSVAQSTDQKAGGSSPSERAQVTGPYPVRGGAFLVPVGATLGAAAANMGPNIAWLVDAATSSSRKEVQPRLAAPLRRGPSVRCHGRLRLTAWGSKPKAGIGTRTRFMRIAGCRRACPPSWSETTVASPMTPRLIDWCLRVILFRLSKLPGMRRMDQACAVPTMSVAVYMILPRPGAVRSSQRDHRASVGFSAAADGCPPQVP